MEPLHEVPTKEIEMQTYFAAIDTDNSSGTVYAVATSSYAALAQALDVGDPCVDHDQDEAGHTPAFLIVPCTPEAMEWIQEHGGAPSRSLAVNVRDGVSLRSEAE